MPFSPSIYTKSLQKGQTLLVIVLIMVVALTVVLSIATRSITNTRISTDEENSQRAFSAAEAGIERALETTADVNNAKLDNNSTINAQVIKSSSTDVVLNGGQTVAKDEGVDLWLSNYDPDPTMRWKNNQQTGDFKIRWQNNNGTCNSAAIEVVWLSGTDTSTAKATHKVFDPCGTRRDPSGSSTNHFDKADTTDPQTLTSPSGDPVSFPYSGTIHVDDGFIARIIPLYTSTKIGVSSLTGSPLPEQGNFISSTGTSGGTTRKINVFQQYPSLPIEVFPYAIFAPCTPPSC